MAEIGDDRPDNPNEVQGRLDAVRRAAEGWRKDLFDPSGKNRLRNYRDLKTGTLDLTPGGQAGVSAQALDELRHTAHALLPAFDREIRSCLEAVVIPLPDKAADRANVLELLGDIRSLLDRCGPEVCSLDLAALQTVFARVRGSSRLTRPLSRELRQGRKTVIARDSNQLPPTAFFGRDAFADDSADETDFSASDVESLLDLAAVFLRETLGVIAFGQQHANAIEAEVRRLQQDLSDPALDTFLDESRDERFFVKNIERVQGDERDAIILSVGYYKDADGRLLYRFGPLNQEGGERRLNVAVTRARSAVEPVSSFSHRDMAPGRSSARGVELLRLCLECAASGGQELGSSAHDVPLNPFELSVQRGLRRRCIPATPQFGVSGYRIDFACAHPDQPGLMVPALEADGASCHSSATARDRDRLRQQVLVDKGWRVHRIWSISWFNNSEAELDRVEAAWREAVANSDAQRQPPQSSDVAPSEPGTTSVPTGRRVRTSAVRTAAAPASRGPRPPVPRVGAAERQSRRRAVRRSPAADRPRPRPTAPRSQP